jgi:hypothetical protein
MNRYLPFLTAILLLIGHAIGTPLISAAVGDRVHLEGFAPGADEVYLFLTGPNLPANGVRLEDISAPVISGDPSTFTRTSVDSDRWEYSWYTRTKGGAPDAGTYTIFILTKPVGKGELAGSEYATIMVSLGEPGLIIVPAGGISITSSGQGSGSFPGVMQYTTSPWEVSDIREDENQTSGIQTEGYSGTDNARVVAGGDDIPKQPPGSGPENTLPENIPLPEFVILTAIGCVTWLEWFKRKTKPESSWTQESLDPIQ